MNAVIPICHEGCALKIWLVIRGEKQAGRLWFDGRAEYSGIKPLKLEDGSYATFSSWYSEWLNGALSQAELRDATS